MLNGSGEGATGKSMDRKERFGMAERMISIGFRVNAKGEVMIHIDPCNPADEHKDLCRL